MIRDIRLANISELKRISDTYENNPLPQSYETLAITESGFGVTRALLEVVMYADSRQNRVKAYKELLEIAKDDAKKLGFGQLYAFVDPPFATILEKRGWKQAKGVCVILELGNGK